MKRLLYIPFDHLHPEYGVLAKADPASDVIVMVESQRMLTGANWHPVRLYFLVSAALHFAEEMRGKGFTVLYLQAPTTIDGLDEAKQSYPGLPILCAEPSSHRQYEALQNYGVEFVENDLFLTTRRLFALWADKQKNFLMENFYRAQRVRLGILVEDGKPVGGQWNFDKENRLPPPKNYTYPPYLEHQVDEIDREVAKRFGIEPAATWGTTRKQAHDQLANFLENHFHSFGPYEDAMTTENWALHHSLISPYLNIGLLHPAEVVTAALKRFERGDIAIAGAEGFIRQVIGWREYINGMYWHFEEDYNKRNALGGTRKLLPLFTDSSKTEMSCVKNIVGDIETRSWTHHIPRLMVLSNLALLTGVNPQEYLQWMRESFIDASDWVMVPNVIGMGMHADGGEMMTKPYVGGGSYISKMSNFCKGCAYDPKLRSGDNACPFTTLYWNFLIEYRTDFSKNHRMAQQLAGINRLKDVEELQNRAQEVLGRFDNGDI
jgi:deoxyribodipyrimidine photolyase-related protein